MLESRKSLENLWSSPGIVHKIVLSI